MGGTRPKATLASGHSFFGLQLQVQPLLASPGTSPFGSQAPLPPGAGQTGPNFARPSINVSAEQLILWV